MTVEWNTNTPTGRTVDLRPGGLLFLPAALHHSVDAVEDSRLSLTLLPA